jgi:hypothetical protein
MDDTLRVRIGDRSRHRLERPPREGGAVGEIFHRQVVRAHFMDDDDVGVAQLRGGRRFPAEAVGVRRLEDLERDGAPEIGVEGLVDDPHSALSDLADDLVLPEPLSRVAEKVLEAVEVHV